MNVSDRMGSIHLMAGATWGAAFVQTSLSLSPSLLNGSITHSSIGLLMQPSLNPIPALLCGWLDLRRSVFQVGRVSHQRVGAGAPPGCS